MLHARPIDNPGVRNHIRQPHRLQVRAEEHDEHGGEDEPDDEQRRIVADDQRLADEGQRP